MLDVSLPNGTLIQQSHPSNTPTHPSITPKLLFPIKPNANLFNPAFSIGTSSGHLLMASIA